MSSLVVLVLGPVAGAVVAWLVGRWPRLVVAVGALLAWGLALWLRLLADNEEVVLVYGRSLTLTPGIQSLLGLLFVGLGLLFVLSLLWPQGRYFVPASLAAVSPMAAALMIRPLTLSVLFWLIAALFLGVVIQSERAGRTQAAWRYVLLTFLAGLLMLAGGWMAETAQTALQETAGQLLAVAFLILLAGFPFHIWLQPVVTAGFDRLSQRDRFSRRGLALVLVLGLGQLVLVVFIYDWLATYPWLGQAASFQRLVQLSSGLTALTAGLLALTGASLRRLLGSLLLLDMSVGLAVLLVPAEVGWGTAVLLPLARSVSLLLVALGGQGLAKDGQAALVQSGAGRRRPIAALTLGYGLLSLLGLPLTVGFSGRWAAIVLVAGQADVSFWLPVSLLLAMGGGIYGVWRGLAPLFMRDETTTSTTDTASALSAGASTSSDAGVTGRQAVGEQVGLLAGVAAGLLLAMTPLGLALVRRLAALWFSAG